MGLFHYALRSNAIKKQHGKSKLSKVVELTAFRETPGRPF